MVLKLLRNQNGLKVNLRDMENQPQRVIQFRAWTGKKMINTGTLHDTTRNGYEMFNGEEYEYFPVMQFTGMLDKYKKEIYENDYLKNPFGIVEVLWNDERQGWLPVVGDIEIDGWEICGNRFENPELLNKNL